MAMAPDGGLQIGFGLGKYTNRNVMDAYAALSRGVEQITVQSSRRLAPEPERTTVGPVRYEVLEPLKTVRFALEPNDCQPLAFDWTFEAELPATLEDRSLLRDGYRTSTDLVRYHQIGRASGWIELDGERTAIDDSWISTRDHPPPDPALPPCVVSASPTRQPGEGACATASGSRPARSSRSTCSTA